MAVQRAAVIACQISQLINPGRPRIKINMNTASKLNPENAKDRKETFMLEMFI